MKIGVITEGRAERAALESLFKRINTRDRSVEVLYVSVDPKDASAGAVARKVCSMIDGTNWWTKDKLVFIIDRENRTECPSSISRNLEDAFIRQGRKKVTVVVKNRKFENWLIADHEAVFSIKDFSVPEQRIREIESGLADNLADAVGMLLQWSDKKYAKGNHDKKICEKLDTARAAHGSRSFRKFMKELGLDSALRKAKEDLRETEPLYLQEPDRDTLFSALASPPEPNEALKGIFDEVHREKV